ncbi:MAG: TerC/Alx family metal homeostasis membrane protein [Bacteroidales bacterium]|nr:TerC/Alx family metal homeostasis membrane protein [Bacteroidales bacterium]
MNPNELLFFSVFLIIIAVFLVLDLGVFDKRNHIIPFKEALAKTLLWIGVSLGFYVLIIFHGEWFHMGGGGSIEEIRLLISKYGHPVNIDGLSYTEALRVYNNNLSLEYLTGYLIEISLSVDNIFVMVMIFFAFGVDPKYYRRVLIWGILAAILLRFLFIFSASAIIMKFGWVLYIFGLLLIYTGIKMFITRNKPEKIDIAHHPVVKFVSGHFPVYPTFVRHHFCITKNGKHYITPLLIVLMVIEFSDVIFAVDSIPAIFSVTMDPYVVFFSNVFAILGLRSMFFMVINIIELFRYLKSGLAFLLVFIGIKMLISHEWLLEIGFTTLHSLLVILSILVVSIVASLIFPEKRST